MVKISFKFAWMTCIILIFWSSCKKEEINPNYVGTWNVIAITDVNGHSLQMKDIKKFTKNEFSTSSQVFDSTANTWINYLQSKGTFTISGDTMNFKIIEYGLSSYDLTGMPTGKIVLIKEGDPNSEYLFSILNLPENSKLGFSITDNEMTVFRDNNADGDYIDPNESVVYIRQ
jgi:hypothetical protein